LRRPNDPPVRTAEYNLDSGDPQRFLSYIKEITNHKTQAADQEKAAGTFYTPRRLHGGSAPLPFCAHLRNLRRKVLVLLRASCLRQVSPGEKLSFFSVPSISMRDFASTVLKQVSS
jgi:hypothetical protein